jgi:hypothetical protein
LSASVEHRNGRGNQTFAVTMPFVVIGILLALLAGAIYVAHFGWVSAGDVTMPAWGWLAPVACRI